MFRSFLASLMLVAAARAEEFTPRELRAPEGMTVEVAAAPPLVQHPVMACLDDQGRLFVCENAGVNLSAQELEQQLPNSIRLLVDDDGDGKFDRHTVFADKMTFPMGAAWLDGSLYVASPPYIWKLTDTDGDGVADERKILVSKFGYTGNAADIHGCFAGPDGRLYWCDGYHGHEFREGDTITSKREGSYLFSCKPDGSDVRIHCGGGMDNPVEVDFTETGDVIGTVNILYTRPRVDCLVHWLHGGAYPHRERVLQELKTTGELLGPAHRFGHVAVSGTMRYRSGLLQAEWLNDYLVTFFNSGKVVRVSLEPHGSTYAAEQRELLSCDDRDFHPTDVLEDADGSLLVLDTGGWFYRGCPTSQLAKPELLGAIYRLTSARTERLEDPRGLRIEWAKLTSAELVGLFDDPRFVVRERAIRQCTQRGAETVPALESAMKTGEPILTANVIWAAVRLVGNGVEAARPLLLAALNQQEPDCRQIACRGLTLYPDPAAKSRLLELLKDEWPAVRRQAADAVGRLKQEDAVPALLAAVEKATDRSEEHALIYALLEINAPDAVRVGLTHASPRIRQAALVALDQMDRQTLQAEQVAPFLNDADAGLRAASLRICQRHAGDATWASQAGAELQRMLKSPALLQSRAETVSGLISLFAGQPTVAQAIGETLRQHPADDPASHQLLQALAAGNGLPLHESWVAPLEAALKSADEPTVRLALAAVRALKSNRFQPAVQSIGQDDDQPMPLRLTALATVAGQSGKLSDEAFRTLTELVGQRSGGATQAAQILGSSPLTDAQLKALAPLLKEAGAGELRDLMRPFQRSSQADIAAAFLDGMENARFLLMLPPHEFSDIIKAYPQPHRDRANLILNRIIQADSQKVQRLDALLPLLSQGDPERGRQLFFAEKSKCATCHRVGEQGKRVGPDLTTIGRNRAPRDLLESIVFPSASIVRDYEPYTLLLASGQTLSGLIVKDAGELLTIQQSTGDPVTVSRNEVEEMVPATVSIMPNGLEKALSEQELADVIAWLMSLR